MKKFLVATAIAMSMVMSVGCASSNADKNTTETTEATTNDTTNNGDSSESQDEQEAAFYDSIKTKSPETLPQLEEPKQGEDVAIINTNMGTIKVRFFPEYAPKAVENFLTHAKDGYYDGVIFHRVIKDFMIQGGDPQGNGTGGESIWGEPFEVEASADLKHIRGALCMAKTSEPVSIGSQFYIVQNAELDESSKQFITNAITDKDQSVYNDITVEQLYPTPLMEKYLEIGGTPSLDFQYTVFGQVYEGLDVVDKIANSETDDNDKPKTDVIINNIEVTTYQE